MAEEFDEEALGPQLGNREGTSRIANVGCVNKRSNHSDLVVTSEFFVLSLANSLDFTLDLAVLGHVGAQNIL